MCHAPTYLAAAVVVLTTCTPASAQEPASSFGDLAARLQTGQSIWVTDAAGHEARGRLERLTTDGLVLKAGDLITLSAADVRRIRTRDRDSIKNGTLIGLGIGAGMATAWCIAAVADDSGDIDARVECAEGYIVYPALGALIGLGIDALIPGKMRVVYQASPPAGRSPAHLGLTPSISPRVKALRLVFSF